MDPGPALEWTRSGYVFETAAIACKTRIGSPLGAILLGKFFVFLPSRYDGRLEFLFTQLRQFGIVKFDRLRGFGHPVDEFFLPVTQTFSRFKPMTSTPSPLHPL